MRTVKELRLAWLIPCYNEAKTIEAVVQRIQSCCPGASIYVYDNGSTDGTAELARKAGAIVRYVGARGKGNVVRRMFSEVDADVFLMMDGDGTYRIEEWQRLTTPIVEGQADMVVATRLESNTPRAFRAFHRIGNFLIVTTINWLFTVRFTDVLSGYRGFSKRFVENVGISAIGFELETELTIKALENRMTVAEVELPYGARPPQSFSKLRTFEDGFVILGTILRLFKDEKPLTFCGLMSIVTFVIGVWEASGPRPWMSVAFFTFSTVSVFTGLILNSISQRARDLTQIIARARSVGLTAHDDVREPIRKAMS